jgi:hypothetical protein
MTPVSFTLCTVDVTNSVHDAAVWWSCHDCGTDLELPARDIAGVVVSCPDCAEPLQELWRWEPVVA